MAALAESLAGMSTESTAFADAVRTVLTRAETVDETTRT